MTVGMPPPVHIDSAHPVILVEQKEHFVRELTNLDNVPVIQHHVGRALRHTAGEVRVQALAPKVGWTSAFPDGLVFLCCPGLHFGLFRWRIHERCFGSSQFVAHGPYPAERGVGRDRYRAVRFPNSRHVRYSSGALRRGLRRVLSVRARRAGEHRQRRKDRIKRTNSHLGISPFGVSPRGPRTPLVNAISDVYFGFAQSYARPFPLSMSAKRSILRL